jgi:signal transduction histidine kinase/CheY-like chemotaxis protein
VPYAGAITFRASRGIDDSRELTLVRKDGSRFPALVLITALKDKPGIIIGYLLIATDNTARMQAQRDLTDASAEIEKASLGKSDFLVQLSHELRTPLNVILGFAELMESGIPPSQKQSLAQIAVAGRYLLDLSNKILDLALIEAGRVTISIAPVSLDDVLRECRDMVALQATERHVRIKYPQFDLPCFVCADRTRLKQVLHNLLLNAIRHNNAGGTVNVDYLFDPKTPGVIHISVRDNGEGLAPERLAQLFEPSNGHGQSARAEAGVGLGLLLAKQLIEKMGGHIGADSAVGVGSTFWIELKTTHTIDLLMPSEDPVTSVIPQSVNDRLKRTLLYVEDNPANLELVKLLIARRPDLRLISAPTGVSGIESARVNQPEVILMDINLPGMNGVEAMKILSTLPSTAHIPVIALSANVMPADIANGLKAGFYLYLTKPIKFNVFMQALDKALDHSRTAAGASNIPDKTPG